MDRVSELLHKVVKGALVVILGVIVVTVTTQIISRQFFGFSFYWSEEIARYLLIWLTFIGASAALRDGDLVGLDLLERALNQRWLAGLKLVVHILCAFFLTYVLYYGIYLINQPSILGQRLSTVPVSMFYVYLCVPLSAAIMLVHLLCAVRQNVIDLLGRN